MQFYFIRHGQSTNNARWGRTGSSHGRSEDPALTATGQRQAESLAQYLSQGTPPATVNGRDPKNLSGFGITHLYCSLMIRAVATATAIAEAIHVPCSAWEDIHETGGIFLDDPETGEHVGLPGKSRAYFEQHYPLVCLPDTVNSHGWWNRPFEERTDRLPRAQRVVRDLMERHGGTTDRVAVVSHGGFYNYVMSVVFDMPRRDDQSFLMNNAAITRIDFETDRTVLVYANRTDFMPDEWIT